MADRMGWGVAGLGARSRVTVPALASLSDCRLAGVVGRDEARTGERAKDWPDLKVYSSLDNLLKSQDVDVLYIATPHYLHVPQAVQAIEAGKHVFMESPLALSVDGAHKLVEKARNKGVSLGIAFQMRFHPALAALRELIAAGELGEARLIEITLAEPATLADTWWADSVRSGPAALFRIGVHALDLAAWLKGGPTVEVAAMGDGDGDRGLNTTVSVLMRFADGAFATATGSTHLPSPCHRVQVEGALGSACVQGDLTGAGASSLVTVKNGQEARREFGPENITALMIEGFNQAVLADADFHPDGTDGKRLVEITCAVIEAMKAKRTVKAGEVARLT